MVSGFFTSPCDHSRIFSGDAMEIRMAENESGSFGFSKKLKMSFTELFPFGLDLAVEEPARVFFYMPFEHSEALEDQDFAVDLMGRNLPKTGAGYLLHARAHREVIRRFGRFPFRNDALGRETTPEEAEFLAGGGYAAIVRELGG